VIIESWKGFYKATLFILSLFESKLLKMGFEDILHFISEFIRNEVFMVASESELLTYIASVYGVRHRNIKAAIA
jgi:hypothetical protein